MSGLPAGWAKAALAELAEFSPKHDPARLGDMISFVPMPAVSAEFGTIEGAVDRPLSDVWKGFTHFADGDVIFAKITPCMENGKIAVARGLTNGLGCGSTEFHVLRSYGSVLPDFLWRFMRQGTFRKDAEASMTGAVGQRRVPTYHLKASELPVPPLAEQRRIVAKLDALTARTARARADLDRIPALTTRYRAAVLAAAFSGDLSATLPEQQPVQELIRSLDQGWSPKCDPTPALADEWAVIKTTAIQSIWFEEGANKRLPTSLTPREAIELTAGDVLITRAGPRSRVGITCLVRSTRPKLMLCDKAYRLRTDPDRLDPLYLTLMLNAPQALYEIESMKTGISDSGLNLTQGKLLALPVPVPALAEQRRLVRVVEKLFTEIDRLTTEAASARRLLDRLDQAVLAKAFRGELVPQDPADEPASVLLDRIRAERAAAPKAKRGRRVAA